jgi:hypothetical protein
MSTKPQPVRVSTPVAFEDGALRIRDLTVNGAMVVLAEESVEAGRDLQLVVRDAWFEAELGPVLDGCFASHADIFEVTGGPPVLRMRRSETSWSR